MLLFIISLLPLMSLMRKGTYESGDLTLHSVFLRSFYESLSEGNLIPRWAGNLCGDKGCPVFLFEYITPFYIGSIFHFLGFSLIDSIKALLAVSFIASGVGMYLFIKNELGEMPAFVSALSYLFAPFHLQEMHFRVGIGMVLSFAFVPFLFLFSKKLVITSSIRYILLNALFFFLLITTHSTVTILVLPLLFGYLFIFLINSKRKKIFPFFLLIVSIILGLGLSCFYWLPALKEIQYTWYLKDLIVNDFKPMQEYIFSPAFYGFLFQGHRGELRLIIGYPHLLIILLALLFLIKKRLPVKEKIRIFYFLFSFAIFFLLLLKISKPFWNYVPFLKSSVLPWRVLMPISFITSYLSAIVVKNIKSKLCILFICIFVVASTILNWGNRKMIPEDPNAYNTHWSLYSEHYEQNDPLLRQNYINNIALASSLVLKRPLFPLEIIKGNGLYKQLERTSTKHVYILKAETGIKIKENTFFFPGWKVFANYKEIPIVYNDPDNLGMITFKLKPGLYKIDAQFTDTPVRRIAKSISVFSTLLIGIYLLYHLLHKRT